MSVYSLNSACFSQRLRSIRPAVRERRMGNGNILDQRLADIKYSPWKKPSNRRNTLPGLSEQGWRIPLEWQRARSKFGFRTVGQNGASATPRKLARKNHTKTMNPSMAHKLLMFTKGKEVLRRITKGVKKKKEAYVKKKKKKKRVHSVVYFERGNKMVKKRCPLRIDRGHIYFNQELWENKLLEFFSKMKSCSRVHIFMKASDENI